MDRKTAKEAFVSDLEGTSQAEVFALVSTLSLSITVCEQFTGARHPKCRLAVELLAVIFLQVLLYTDALPAWPSAIACLCAASAGAVWVFAQAAQGRFDGLPTVQDLAGSRKRFISLFRGALMAATCICILAVDFRAFPRRYAKTEYYGTGYMDVGVGGVVLAGGAVSPMSLAHRYGPDGQGNMRRPEAFVRRLYGGLRGAAACWLLGLARLVSTRAIDYQAHVGEYGVHWNFFDTIAVVALLGNVVVLPPGALAPAAVAVTALHQIALSVGGLGPWVMSPVRSADMLSLNKEGVVSCLGFWALYLWGAALAQLMHTTLQPAVRHLYKQAAAPAVVYTADTGDASGSGFGGGFGGGDGDGGGGNAEGSGGGGESNARGGGGVERMARLIAAAAIAAARPLLRWWLQWVAVDVALWAAVAALESRVERISRRSCNAAYILWIAAQCLAGMLPLALWQAIATAIGACAAGSGVVAVQREGPAAEGGDPGEIEGGRLGRRSGEDQALAERQRLETRLAKLPMEPPDDTSRRAGADSWGPRILLAVNRNQLAVFLLANLFTGAINLSIDTLQVTDWPARMLLGTYMACVCSAALALNHFGWRVKL